VYPDTVVQAVGSGFTRRVIGGDDESFVTGPTQMLKEPNHRVADTVDIREERLGDDRNAHTTTVSAPTVDEVADGHTGREI
jgi:hypothetical protein